MNGESSDTCRCVHSGAACLQGSGLCYTPLGGWVGGGGGRRRLMAGLAAAVCARPRRRPPPPPAPCALLALLALLAPLARPAGCARAPRSAPSCRHWRPPGGGAPTFAGVATAAARGACVPDCADNALGLTLPGARHGAAYAEAAFAQLGVAGAALDAGRFCGAVYGAGGGAGARAVLADTYPAAAGQRAWPPHRTPRSVGYRVEDGVERWPDDMLALQVTAAAADLGVSRGACSPSPAAAEADAVTHWQLAALEDDVRAYWRRPGALCCETCGTCARRGAGGNSSTHECRAPRSRGTAFPCRERRAGGARAAGCPNAAPYAEARLPPLDAPASCREPASGGTRVTPNPRAWPEVRPGAQLLIDGLQSVQYTPLDEYVFRRAAHAALADTRAALSEEQIAAVPEDVARDIMLSGAGAGAAGGSRRLSFQKTVLDHLCGYGFTVKTPDDYDPSGARRHPLIIGLHAGWGAHLDESLGFSCCFLPSEVTGDAILVVPARMEAHDFDTRKLLDVIADVKAHLRVDDGRVYAVGQSMGGRAVYILAAHAPEHFAALIAISAHHEPFAYSPLAPAIAQGGVPIFAWHGTADPVSHLSEARAMRDAMAEAGATFELHLFEGQHGIFGMGPAYEQLKSRAKEVLALRRKEQPAG